MEVFNQTYSNGILPDTNGEFSFQVPAGHWSFYGNGSQVVQKNVTGNISDLVIKHISSNTGLIAINALIGGVGIMGGEVKVYTDADYTNLLETHTFFANTGTLTSSGSPHANTLVLKYSTSDYQKLFFEVEKNGVTARQEATIPTSGTSYLFINLAETYTVSGTVYDTDGVTPLGDTVVNVHPNGSNSPIIATTTTDSNGKYRVDLPKGKYNIKPFGANNTRRKMRFVEIVDASIPNINFTVGADGANIQGMVRLNNVYFPNDWTVDLNVYSDAGFTNLIATQKLNLGASASVSYYISDIPGSSTVYVRAKYAGLEYSYPNPVTTSVGTTSRNININIERTEYTVSGRVKYRSTDDGVPTRPVDFFNNAGMMFGSKTATTNLQGNYTITLPPGTYWAREAANTQYSPSEPIVVAGANTTAPDIIIGDAESQLVNFTITSGGTVVAGVEMLAIGEDGEVIKKTISHSMSTSNNATMRIGSEAGVKKIRIKSPAATYEYNMPSTGNLSQTVELPII